MKIKALPFVQEGVTMFNCVVPFSALQNQAKIDEWGVDQNGQERGYQRKPETARIGRVARFLKQDPRPLLPTSILVSYRGKLSVTQLADGQVEIEIPETDPLWIVDGQHRFYGIKHAVEELGVTRLKDYQLPVVIVPFERYEDEAEQFRIINETMKKMRTDLARRLLAMKLQLDPSGTRRGLRDSGKLWEAMAVDVLKHLADTPGSPWFGRIQRPNERKQSRHVIRELSFSTSLKPILNEYPWRTWPTTRVADVLSAYWNAWKNLVPEAFDEAQDYVLLKTPGAFALHQLAVFVLQVLKARGILTPTEADIQAVLADLGDYASADFWRADNRDGAALAGSMKGFAILADTLIEELRDAGHSDV